MSDAADLSRYEQMLERCEYTREAVEFIQQSLTYTVETAHGKLSEQEQKLFRLMDRQKLDYSKLEETYHSGQLDEELAELVEALGGPEKVNRHVTGKQLCYGVRELALKRWGCMAPAVLMKWGIRATSDIGKIVFFLVENHFLQKQETDRLQDFENVYDFKTSFGPGAVFEDSASL